MKYEAIAERMTKVELVEHVENLLDKIDDLLAQRDRLRAALKDALSGLRYIRQEYGELPGVGWERLKESEALQEAGDDG